MRDEEKNKDYSKTQPKQRKLKSISDKERSSEKNRSKQQLKNYVEGGFDEDDWDDTFTR